MSTSALELAGLQRRELSELGHGAPTIRAVLHRKTARVGLAIIAALLAFLFAVPLLSPHDVYSQDGIQLQGPSSSYPLGTDQLGRDVLVRIAAGGRTSLSGAVLALSAAVASGLVVGVTAAVSGRRVDSVLMRGVDAINGIPPLVIPIALVGALGPSYTNLLAAIVISYVPSYARIARTFAGSLRGRLDIISARLMGVSRTRIAATHVLPAVFTQMLVIATLDVGSVIVSLSGLSFLGLGAQAPRPEWGLLLNDGEVFFAVAPWMLLGPGMAITMVIVASNLIGEALRDALAERDSQ